MMAAAPAAGAASPALPRQRWRRGGGGGVSAARPTGRGRAHLPRTNHTPQGRRSPPAAQGGTEPAAQPAAGAQQQRRLDAERVCELVASTPALSRLLGGVKGLRVHEMLDGVINVVFAVHGPSGRSAVVKQALPYVRAVGESFPLSRERMDVEAAAMRLVHAACPPRVPELLWFDPADSVLAMQFVPPPHQKLLYAIREGQVLPELADQLAELLSAYLARTSLSLLPQGRAAAAVRRFANEDIVGANERVVLTSPFDPGDATNRWSSPELDDDVRALWDDPAVQQAAASALHTYRRRKEALVHNDLHAGNLLVAAGSAYLIDWEFSTVGPLSFDLGSLAGNLCLAALSLQGMAQCEGGRRPAGGARSRREQAEWLLQALQDTWEGFLQRYPVELADARAAAVAAGAGGDLWAAALGGAAKGRPEPSAAGEPAAAAPPALDEQQLLLDSCRFAGCCLVRLTIGIHHYPSIEALPNAAVRVATERRCLALGRQLLLAGDGGGGGGPRVRSMRDVVRLVQAAAGGWLGGG